MAFRITGLSPEPFRHLFGLSDEALAAHGAKRCVADGRPVFPDRIEVRDAEAGEPLLLVNYTHQPANTPFRSSYAIYVSERATAAYDRTDEVPDVFRTRLLSLRGFDKDDMLVAADVVDGHAVEEVIARFFAGDQVAYIHAHYAKPGCYAARIDRA